MMLSACWKMPTWETTMSPSEAERLPGAWSGGANKTEGLAGGRSAGANEAARAADTTAREWATVLKGMESVPAGLPDPAVLARMASEFFTAPGEGEPAT